MKLGKTTIPSLGDVLSDERLLYFISGRVVDGKIRARIDDRDWHYTPKKSETLAYYITNETDKKYTCCKVRIDKRNVVTYVASPTCYAKKSEMKCIRTPSLMQNITAPCMGMYTFDKEDFAPVIDAMVVELVEEINFLNDQVAANRSAIEMS